MRPVIVTDVRYRTALAVIRPLGRAGYPVYAVQTAAESPRKPAAFSSRYVYKAVMLEGSVKDKDYAAPYAADQRTVVGIGINFSSEKGTIDGFKSEIFH